MDEDIGFEVRGHAGVVTLNRPRALNALTQPMIVALRARLTAWAGDPAIRLVVVRAAGEKAFCAGGDIRRLYEWGRAGAPDVLRFYREEYRLNAFIARFPKPYVALIDGIVMGGGVGISVHGTHRVGGPRTVFAMPETGIGLFPDVGGTYFLPRLPGRAGTWLALSGARLKQADSLWAGVLTHATPSDAFEPMVDALSACDDVDATLAGLADDPGQAPAETAMPAIDRCFGGATVEDALAALDAEGGAHGEWARRTAADIRAKSPTSLKIAMRQMQEGARADFESCMRIEYRIVSRIVLGHDFYEGVRALIIDKDDRPRWRPARLEDVADADIDRYFAPLGADELDLA